ncbi:LPS export ABC transporter periplasmic protein LptC [candidate division KSB1 bacterium]|nr:LPS export ABC transporter periplasmic protein LptC [candidate division KSB1 bacterium]
MTRNFIKKNLWGKAFGILALYVLPACIGCQSAQEPAPSATNAEGPDQEGWNSKVTVTSNGKIAAHVQYGHMEKYSKKHQTQFDEGIAVDFYNTKGEHTSFLTAEKGLLFEDTNDVEAYENVVAKSDSGITLRSQRLKWLNRTQRIVTDDFVTITRPNGDMLHGQGFESDQNLKNWIIKKPSGATQRKFELPRSTPRPLEQTADSSAQQRE